MQLTEEQLKIKAFGEEINRKAREPKQTAEQVVDELNSGEKSPLFF